MLRNGLEPWHILVVVAVVVLLFGSKKLPDMARGLGKSMRILKAETAALREEGSAPATTEEATTGAENAPSSGGHPAIARPERPERPAQPARSEQAARTDRPA
ncbi:Sec-independent protein translocase subunit TatA [Kitasatospora viridis]|uniref:Sec-independent protein translocase protein TatA n=1 Tax=Kitasatospora viridis TaxID=281105 RepID=A0A561T7F9_9ACTN|nr:Sec-independent protein translocase subunit TatA [Kitasatospora viridis]TWF83045.1 sec-independent protein translocase protein TatA [Kitasatospora viridis]